MREALGSILRILKKKKLNEKPTFCASIFVSWIDGHFLLRCKNMLFSEHISKDHLWKQNLPNFPLILTACVVGTGLVNPQDVSQNLGKEQGQWIKIGCKGWRWVSRTEEDPK
jgi:hypothetical protein